MTVTVELSVRLPQRLVAAFLQCVRDFDAAHHDEAEFQARVLVLGKARAAQWARRAHENRSVKRRKAIQR